MTTKYIRVNSYEQWADTIWDGKSVPESGIVYMPTEATYDFFKICKETPNRYILLTACSDFSIYYQQEAHPNMDLWKMSQAVDWNTVLNERKHYYDVTITSRKANQCHPGHKFSVKCDRFTHHSFSEIPQNIVLWLSTNCNVFEDKIVWIPFGINSGDKPEDGCNIIQKYKKPWHEKQNKIYVSFQNYTNRRIDLKEKFSQVSPDIVTFRKDVGLPIDKFYEEVSDHKYILNPYGNGLDSYRTYESMILGSVPIMESNRFSRYLEYHGLPIIIVNNLEKLPTFESMEKIYQENLSKRSLQVITEEFWEKRIEEYKTKLLG